jgi:hypothetical protein
VISEDAVNIPFLELCLVLVELLFRGNFAILLRVKLFLVVDALENGALAKQVVVIIRGDNQIALDYCAVVHAHDRVSVHRLRKRNLVGLSKLLFLSLKLFKQILIFNHAVYQLINLLFFLFYRLVILKEVHVNLFLLFAIITTITQSP